MVEGSRDCNRKVWGYRTHEFIAGRADSDPGNVGKIVVVPVEQVVVYSTLPQEYSTLTFRGEVLLVVVEWKRGAK